MVTINDQNHFHCSDHHQIKINQLGRYERNNYFFWSILIHHSAVRRTKRIMLMLILADMFRLGNPIINCLILILFCSCSVYFIIAVFGQYSIRWPWAEPHLTIIFIFTVRRQYWLHSHPSHNHNTFLLFFSFFFPRYLNIKNVLSVKKIILSFNNSINNNHIGSWKLIMNRQTRSYFVRMIICLSMKDINQNVYLNQKMEVTDGILWWGGGGRIFNIKKVKSTDFWQ